MMDAPKWRTNFLNCLRVYLNGYQMKSFEEQNTVNFSTVEWKIPKYSVLCISLNSDSLSLLFTISLKLFTAVVNVSEKSL